MRNYTNPVEHVLSKLPTAKPNGDGWLACCPAHDDRSPSLSIKQGDDGRVLMKCFAGCSHDAIVLAMDLESKDLFVPRDSSKERPPANGDARSKPTPSPKAKGIRYETASAAVSALMKQHDRPAGQWTYPEASGEPVALVLRFNKSDGSKEFRPISRHNDGGWYIKAPATRRPLYGLPDLPAASVVYVCEGEKAADAARSIGLIATTSMGGSQAAEQSDWKPLVGKTVVILPDHDEAGRKYADAVADILHRLDSSTMVKIVELPGLLAKGDVVEWIEAHGEAAEPEAMRLELERLVDESVAVECERPEPITERFEPFPVDALPEPVRSFVVAGGKSLGCDASFVALPVFAMLGAAVGNSRRLLIKPGWTAPPIVWSVIVGNSGSCKSPALELALKPVKDRQRDGFRQHAEAMSEFQTAVMSHAKAVELWKRDKTGSEPPTPPAKPVAERFHTNDTTIESLAGLLQHQPRGFLVSRDELAGWLGGFDRYSNGKGGDVAKWLELFDGRSSIIDRKTGEPPTLFIPHAAVCLTGGIQPETLKRCLVQSHLDNGLAARLLFAFPPARPRRWTDAVVDEQLEREFGHVVDMLFHLQFGADESGETEPKLVTLSAAAKRRFQQFVNEQGAEHVELSDDLSAAWSKLEGYAARFALILQLVRAATGEADETIVDETSMDAGITLSRWFGREAKRIYAMLGESNGDGEQRKLAEWIDRKGGSVTAREVRQGHRRFKTTDDAEAALDQLAKAEAGQWEPIPTTPKGGRSSRRFTLSTPSTSAKPQETSCEAKVS